MNGKKHELFAVASPGLERVVAWELRALGFADARELPGGAAFRGTLADALKANLWLRTASRILLRLAVFDAPGKRELIARTKRVDLAPFVAAGSPVHVSVACHQSRLYHTGLVTDAVREALQLPAAPKDAPAPSLHVRLQKDRCTLSIDTSGELLHRRGYRLETSRAPLRETLAAGMLLLCGYDGTQPFVDPMCGSGTIPIEAALIATGRAPNATRAMALEQFPAANGAGFQAIREAAKAVKKPTSAVIVGADIHAGALHASRSNAQRAGVTDLVRFERSDVARLQPPAPKGLLITNPPYGKRIQRDRSERDDPFVHLAAALTGAFAGWDRFVLGPGVELRRSLKLPVIRAIRLDNGGLPVELLQYRPQQVREAT